MITNLFFPARRLSALALSFIFALALGYGATAQAQRLASNPLGPPTLQQTQPVDEVAQNRQIIQSAAAAAPAASTDYSNLKTQVGECANVDDLVYRNQCYTRLAESLGFTTSARQQQQKEVIAKFGFWEASTKLNNLGENVTYLRLPANNSLTTSAGVQKTPDLVISCHARTTDVYIDWKTPIWSYNYAPKSLPVNFRIDTESAQSQNWPVSDDRAGLFAPDPITLVRAMKGRKSFVFQFTPQNEGIISMAFTLDGLDNALQIILERCYR